MKSSIRVTQPEKRQAGAATLLMATVLLMAVSMIGVYSTRSGVVEQRVAANTLWNKNAMDTAQASIDNLLAVNQETLQKLVPGANSIRLTNDPNDKTAYVKLNPTRSDNKQGSANIFTVPDKAIYTADVTTTDNFDTITVALETKGAGNVATKKLVQGAKFGAYIKEVPDAPTALGDITTTTITKSFVISPATKTASVTIPKCPKKAALMAKTINKAAAPTITTISTVSQLTVSGGATFNGYTPGQFEASFFSDSAAHIRENAALHLDCTTKVCTETNIPSTQTGLIWVDGNLTLDNKAEIGYFGAKNGDAKDSVPVLLVVSGNLLINDATVNGLVYVLGNWDNSAAAKSGTVNGTVIVNGTGTANGTAGNEAGDFIPGSLVMNYEYWLLQNVLKLGSYARLAGTWRDF